MVAENEKNDVQLGQEALDSGNQVLALKYFSQAYENKSSFHLNRKIVTLFAELGEYRMALHTAEDYLFRYRNGEKFFGIYFKLLLQNHYYIRARKELFRLSHIDPVEPELIVDFLNQLEIAEAYRDQVEGDQRSIDDFIKEKESLSAAQQLTLEQVLGELTYEKYLVAAKELLQNPKLKYLFRSKILEDLVLLETDQSFDFLYFTGEMKTVNPIKLITPAASSTYQEIIQFLERALENQNPSLLYAVKSVVDLHFAVLFPFADELVVSPRRLANAYLFSNGETQDYSERELKEELKLISKLQDFCLTLVQ